MATKKPKLALELLVIRFNFTGLQTYVTSEGDLKSVLKKVTGGMVNKKAIMLQVSDCFRGGHRDGVCFMTTNRKQYDKALKFLTKLQDKKGCLSVNTEIIPGAFNPYQDEGDKLATLNLNY